LKSSYKQKQTEKSKETEPAIQNNNGIVIKTKIFRMMVLLPEIKAFRQKMHNKNDKTPWKKMLKLKHMSRQERKILAGAKMNFLLLSERKTSLEAAMKTSIRMIVSIIAPQ